MSANLNPIYTRVADVQWASGYITLVNTTPDLTTGTVGTNIYTLFTADSVNGGYVQKIRLRATPAGNTTATVLRLWLNNGGSTGSAGNNILIDEITLPAVTASASSATPNFEIPVNLALPPGYVLYATLGTGSANGWAVTVFGGKY